MKKILILIPMLLLATPAYASVLTEWASGAGSNNNLGTVNNRTGQEFVLSADATVTDIQLFGSAGAGGAGTYTIEIDSGSFGGTTEVSTTFDPTTWGACCTASWNTISIPSTHLVAGTYWIVINQTGGSASDGYRWEMDSDVSYGHYAWFSDAEYTGGVENFIVDGTPDGGGGGGGGATSTPPDVFFGASTTYSIIDYPNMDYFSGIILFMGTFSFVVWFFRRRV